MLIILPSKHTLTSFYEVFVGISVFFQDHMRRWNDKDVPSYMIISGPSPGQSGHEKPFFKSMSSNFKKDSQALCSLWYEKHSRIFLLP